MSLIGKIFQHMILVTLLKLLVILILVLKAKRGKPLYDIEEEVQIL